MTTQSSARFHTTSQTDVKESNAPITSLLSWGLSSTERQTYSKLRDRTQVF